MDEEAEQFVGHIDLDHDHPWLARRMALKLPYTALFRYCKEMYGLAWQQSQSPNLTANGSTKLLFMKQATDQAIFSC